MRKPYFPRHEGAPAPLTATVPRVVRFDEVDLMGIVWHGRYAGFFEDARTALGNRVGLGYMDFYRNGVMAPLKKLHVEYLLPLRFEEPFTVEARLHWTEAARIDMDFLLRKATGELATTGYSVQLLLDLSGEVLLAPPPFHQDVLNRWRAGELS